MRTLCLIGPVLLFFISACTPPAAKVNTLTASGQVYEMLTGDSVKISLEQCIGCADGWKVLEADTLVEVRDDGLVSFCKDCVGGRGNANFMIHAIHPGDARILFQVFSDSAEFRFKITGR